MEANVQYRPEIDGLRTIAVVPVILFHAGVETLSGGFVGVDIFFVISGYLITSILLRDLEADRYSILKFYERRARRILPALIFITFVSVPFAFWLLPPKDLYEYFESLLGIATFSSNFVFDRQADYFDTSGSFKPMLHTWSLAVEEQYYILFPPLLAIVWRWKHRAVLPMLAAGFVASLLLAEVVIGLNPTHAFYMLPTRAWELAIGGILAVLAPDPRWQGGPGLAQIGSMLGIAMIMLAIVVIDETVPFPGTGALLPAIGTALVIHFARPGTLTCRLLSLAPMVGIGLISYSAYLWHQPLLAFTRHYYALEAPALALAVMVALTFALAWFSWRFVEAPFRDRNRVATKPIFLFSGLSLAGLAAASLVGPLVAERFPAYATERKPHLLAYRYDNRALQDESWNLLQERTGQKDYGVTQNVADKRLWFDPQDKRAKVLVIGNSHAKDIYNTLVGSEQFRSRFQIARYGCQIVDAASSALRSPNYEAADIIVVASLYSPGDRKVLEALSRQIVGDGKQVVLVKQISEAPEFRDGTLSLTDKVIVEAIESGERSGAGIASAVNTAYFTYFRDGKQPRGSLKTNELIKTIGKRNISIVVVDRMDLICDGRKQMCFAANGTLEKYFYDYGHNTLEGARFFGKRIDETGWLISKLDRSQ